MAEMLNIPSGLRAAKSHRKHRLYMMLPSIRPIFAVILFCTTVSTVYAQSPQNEMDEPRSPAQSVSDAGGSGISMRVLWTINEYRLSPDALMSEAMARAYLFKPLDIDQEASQITFAGQACQDVVFQMREMSSTDYFKRAFHITPNAIGVPEEKVQVFNTNCNIPGFSEYVRLNDSRLIVSIQGVFFFFNPRVTF